MDVLFEWLLLAQVTIEIDAPDRPLARPSRFVTWLFGDPRGRGGWDGR
jgi:hypothetical protein